MSKDKGWDYLNSEDVNTTFHDEDGSWGVKNSDGSGSYYGADGSWGFINEDGSGSYYGADGSWGYKNEDGGGAYYGSDNSSTYYSADVNNDSDDSIDGIDVVAGLAGIVMGIGTAVYEKQKVKIEEEERLAEEHRKEDERIKKEKQAIREKENRLRKKRVKAFFLDKKKLQIDYTTSDLVGRKCDYVIEILKDTGFNNYKTVPVKDVYVDTIYYIGEVAQVIINGQSWVDKGEMIPYDAEIIISYHVKREFVFPYSLRQMVNKDVDSLLNELTGIGFTEVFAIPLNDLKIGWLKKDRSVQQVDLVGVQVIKKGMVLDYDTKIMVKYHSFNGKEM